MRTMSMTTITTLPCPNASNYDPANPYKHYVAAITAIGDLPIPYDEQRRIIIMIGKARTEAYCQGNAPKEPF